MKKNVRDILESVVVFVLVFLLTATNFISQLDYILRDALYQIPRGITSNIKIIGIDERTLEELGPINTWSRQYYADLIAQLNSYEEAKPAVIGFDILFSGNVDEEGDTAFADAVQESQNVVTVSQLIYSEKREIDDDNMVSYPVDNEIYPYDALRMVSKAGYSNVAQDSDGTVRRVRVSETVDGEEQYMF